MSLQLCTLYKKIHITKQHILQRFAKGKKKENQIRKIPTINFFLDDSLDYIDDIEKALKSKDNPIK